MKVVNSNRDAEMGVKQTDTFEWTEPALQAAELVAEGRLSDTSIAVKCGFSRSTFYRLKNTRNFRAKVNELVSEIELRIMSRGIARRGQRVKAKNDRWYGLKHIIAERGADPDMQTVPGGKTGLLVRTQKILGKGQDAQVVTEFAVDTGLLAEMRALEKDAAIEKGEWTEKRDVTKRDEPWTLDLTRLSNEQLDQLESLITAARDDAGAAGAGALPPISVPLLGPPLPGGGCDQPQVDIVPPVAGAD